MVQQFLGSLNGGGKCRDRNTLDLPTDPADGDSHKRRGLVIDSCVFQAYDTSAENQGTEQPSSLRGKAIPKRQIRNGFEARNVKWSCIGVHISDPISLRAAPGLILTDNEHTKENGPPLWNRFRYDKEGGSTSMNLKRWLLLNHLEFRSSEPRGHGGGSEWVFLHQSFEAG